MIRRCLYNGITTTWKDGLYVEMRYSDGPHLSPPYPPVPTTVNDGGFQDVPGSSPVTDTQTAIPIIGPTEQHYVRKSIGRESGASNLGEKCHKTSIDKSKLIIFYKYPLTSVNATQQALTGCITPKKTTPIHFGLLDGPDCHCGCVKMRKLIFKFTKCMLGCIKTVIGSC